MEKEVKRWKVEYDHRDGRKGAVECTTEVGKSGSFDYGNGECGMLTVGDFMQGYDLRYNSAEDLHMEMLSDYFGKGLVKATRI